MPVRKILAAIALIFLGLLPSVPALAGDDAFASKDVYFVGTVESVGVGTADAYDQAGVTTPVRVRVDDSTGDGYVVDATYQDNPTMSDDDLSAGERVVVLGTDAFLDGTRWIVTERYRIPQIVWMICGFFLVGVLCAGIRGVTSVLGLGFSVLVLFFYTVPTIARGADPFVTAIVTAIAIAVVSLFIAHGFNRQTLLSLMSTLATLLLALGISAWFVHAAGLLGFGSEEAYVLQFSGLPPINPRGLLLAGMVIGILGVLDDVTTAQTAAVKELKSSAVHLSVRELFSRGMAIGREHVASLVNTIALAYAGVSLPLLLVFSSNDSGIPTWVILNGEIISQEIVRTLVGSVVLVLAVPIATSIAAISYSRRPPAP